MINMAVPIQMRYNITSRGVGARHCRAPTGVPHVNENRYNSIKNIISAAGTTSTSEYSPLRVR
ncbi:MULTISPECIES: hypothetical protein [Nostoc]|uniref:Uncharacterized protein n=2 Tax=Nostoc TaxID=1177 RepID=A0ABR8F686_NOSLI|nr:MULTISPECIES: hypothetical protein [Nostoc]MBD2564416.1 hypothetical protein [Nostoc linckia FACHB-391]